MEASVLPKVESGKVELVVNSDLSFLRVATSYVESASLAFGLGETETLSLTLAVEEIFVQLCKIMLPTDTIRINVFGSGFEVVLEFIFSSHDLDLRSFNMVCVPDDSGDFECNDETGMIIASRMVDSFSLDSSESHLKLKLVKEKYYPEIEHLSVVTHAPSGALHIREAGVDELKELTRMASVNYTQAAVPESFKFPGKVVDMASVGYLKAAVATDNSGVLAGGLVWKSESDKLVTFRGPYVAPECRGTDIASRLVDYLLEHVARTNALGVMSTWPSSDLPTQMFENLGSQFFFEDSRQQEVNAYFRLLHEDDGNVVTVHPCMVEFLREKYLDLFLARHIETFSDSGETRAAHSVLSAFILRMSNRIILRPVIYGRDALENIKAHVNFLMADGLTNIFFQMDLGFADNGRFAPALIHNSFQPRIVVPMAGRSDMVIFQYIPGGDH